MIVSKIGRSVFVSKSAQFRFQQAVARTPQPILPCCSRAARRPRLGQETRVPGHVRGREARRRRSRGLHRKPLQEGGAQRARELRRRCGTRSSAAGRSKQAFRQPSKRMPALRNRQGTEGGPSRRAPLSARAAVPPRSCRRTAVPVVLFRPPTLDRLVGAGVDLSKPPGVRRAE